MRIAPSKATSTSVSSSGRITAGRIALTAKDAAHLIESVVNTTGVLEASDARAEKGGTVVFGGKIELTARDVTVGAGAALHADGRNGGGAIKIGGGWQGRGTIPNARNTTIAEGATVTANAREKGQGGTIAVWADQATRFGGRIEAKGGPKGGNGGNIETSGKEQLGVTGTVDASAPKGKAGDWLLDPRNVTISGAGSYSVNPAGETVDPGSDNFTILDSSISTALSNGNNVTITTGTTGAQTGDITLLNASIAKTGGGDATLTLKADGSIYTSGTNSITSNTGKLHTILWADADSATFGKISLSNTTITTKGGDIVLAGGLDNGTNGGVAGDGRPDNFAESNANYGVNIDTNSILNAGGGNIIAYGYGPQRGILTNSGAQIRTSGAGNIAFIGSSYGSGANSYGVNINNNSSISAGSGTITLTGSSTGTATTNFGTAIENAGTATTVETTGNGNIVITSTKGGAGGGTDFYLGGTVMSTVRSLGTGTITVNADGIAIGNTTMQTNGSIAFKPRTPGTTIGVAGGTCGGSCNLLLTDAVLARLFPDNDGNGVGSLIIGNATAGTGIVDINGWDLSGKTYDVEVYGGTVDLTGGPITWNGGNDLTLYSRTGNLVIDQNFTRSGGTAGDGTLTLKASGSITTSGTPTISAATAGATGKLNTILWSDADNNSDGYIWLIDTSITSNGGDFIAAGGLDDGANGGVAADGRPDGFSYGGPGSVHGFHQGGSTGAISTASGSILIRAVNHPTVAGHGVIIYENITATTGAIKIEGRSRSSASYGHGIVITGGVVQSGGPITINGYANPTGTNSTGLLLYNSGSILSTGSGAIDIYATKGSAGTEQALTLAVGNPVIGGPNATGDITIKTDSLNFNNLGTVQTTGNILITPITPGTTIGISGGTCGSSCNLLITDSVLARLFPDNDGNGVGSLIIGDATAGTGLVDINGWNISGKTYDVEVYGGTVDLTGGAVTWNGGNDLTLYSRTGDFVIDQNFTRSAGTAGDGTLTLKAAGRISNAGVGDIVAATSGATGKLHTILWSDADPGGPDSNGYIYLAGATVVTSNDGDIILGGGLDDGANGGVAGDGRPDGYAVGVNTQGVHVNSGSDVFSGNGNIVLRGDTTGSSTTFGVLVMSGGRLRSDGGSIDVKALSHSSGTAAHGMAINSGSAGATGIFTASGDITIDAQYLASTAGGVGLVLWNNATIATTGVGDVTIATYSNLSGNDFYANNGSAPASRIGDPLMTGDITIITDDLNNWGSNLPIQTTGTVTFKPYTAGRPIQVAGSSGLLLYANTIGSVDAGRIVIGDATSGLITVNPYATWASRALSGVSFLSGPGGITFTPGAHDFGTRSLTGTTSGPLTVDGAITAGDALLQTTGATSDITIGAAGSLTASGTGDALTLASARNFINNGGAGALSTPAGRWLVYSGSPGTNANGGLVADFTRYGCDYGTCTGFTPGLDGFLYREIIGGSSGGGMAPTPPVAAPTPPAPPVSAPGGARPPTISAPVITTGLPDFVRKQDIVTRIQVEAPLHGSAPGLPAPGPDLEDGVTPTATQEEADSRIRADDRRRRWFAGELYTVSPDLARDLESD